MASERGEGKIYNLLPSSRSRYHFLDRLDDYLPWKIDANCKNVDPNIFYPHNVRDTWEAKQICKACPVIKECLEYALDNERNSYERHGVWGGKDQKERASIARKRNMQNKQQIKSSRRTQTQVN